MWLREDSQCSESMKEQRYPDSKKEVIGMKILTWEAVSDLTEKLTTAAKLTKHK